MEHGTEHSLKNVVKPFCGNGLCR
uniref:Uncharacterized protein n=1 Tax=Anguilla anguilla TaxID=7936 RepID=A0A0E9S0H2_ANGAN